MTQRLDHFKTRFQSWPAVAFLSVLVLLSGVRLNAQSTTGVSGTVTDNSGAVIPNAHITATNKATGVTSSAITSSEGTFTIVGVLPGQYTVTVDSQQFKKAQLDVVVEVARITTVNVQMEVGATTETVQVQASVLSLDTAAPVIGTTLEPELGEERSHRNQ